MSPTPTTRTPERLAVGRDELTFHVTSAESGGALVAVETRLPPGGGPPALHRHPSTEVYRVDRGELVIYLADEHDDDAIERIVSPPGSVVHIPGGRAHTVRNESDRQAVAYVVFAPGDEMERFARDVAARAADGPPSPQDVVALAEWHGIEMTDVIPT